MRTPHKLRVALGFPSGIAIGERVQQGVISYARERGGWSFTRDPEMLGTTATWLQNWRGDGAFVFATNEREVAFAKELEIPVVNLSTHVAPRELPTVSSDHHAIGRMAAEHLLSRRFRRLAFYGLAGIFFSEERLRGFQEGAGKRITVDKLLAPLLSGRRFSWTEQEKALESWLQKLEHPVGIFAATDRRADILLGACRRLGLHVPRDVAVLGVDNDPLVWEISEPALSSVARNDFEAGRQAAILLEALILQKPVPEKRITVAPLGIVERESTRTVAIDDPVIAAAVERIRNRISEPFGAAEIAAEAPISRRHFESRFQKALGQTPYAFISQLRVERAKAMLEAPDPPPLTDIAAACGFSSPTRFRLVFLRSTGKVPSEWPGAGDAVC